MYIYSTRRVIAVVLAIALAIAPGIPQSEAQRITVPPMPAAGSMVQLSEGLMPAHVQGLVVHPENPFQFDFLIHQGDRPLNKDAKQAEYNKLITYFLAALTVNDKDQWVNLSPYEQDRIIADSFGRTGMGRDLLAQDYLLKQLTSSLMYPESGLGKEFWRAVYRRAYEETGHTNIPVNTFNKVWIVPAKAVIYESGNTAYIAQSRLKVMMEEDYLARNVSLRGAIATKQSDTSFQSSQTLRDIILPIIEKEVNEGKNFAVLRQIYSSMILATWYKKSLKASLLGQVYADQGKVKGIDQDPAANAAIYDQYLAAFKKGVYNFIKEEKDPYTQNVIPRKYFAGGFTNDLAQVAQVRRVDQDTLNKVLRSDGGSEGRIDAAMVNFAPFMPGGNGPAFNSPSLSAGQNAPAIIYGLIKNLRDFIRSQDPQGRVLKSGGYDAKIAELARSILPQGYYVRRNIGQDAASRPIFLFAKGRTRDYTDPRGAVHRIQYLSQLTPGSGDAFVIEFNRNFGSFLYEKHIEDMAKMVMEEIRKERAEVKAADKKKILAHPESSILHEFKQSILVKAFKGSPRNLIERAVEENAIAMEFEHYYWLAWLKAHPNADHGLSIKAPLAHAIATSGNPGLGLHYAMLMALDAAVEDRNIQEDPYWEVIVKIAGTGSPEGIKKWFQDMLTLPQEEFQGRLKSQARAYYKDVTSGVISRVLNDPVPLKTTAVGKGESYTAAQRALEDKMNEELKQVQTKFQHLPATRVKKIEALQRIARELEEKILHLVAEINMQFADGSTPLQANIVWGDGSLIYKVLNPSLASERFMLDHSPLKEGPQILVYAVQERAFTHIPSGRRVVLRLSKPADMGHKLKKETLDRMFWVRSIDDSPILYEEVMEKQIDQIMSRSYEGTALDEKMYLLMQFKQTVGRLKTVHRRLLDGAFPMREKGDVLKTLRNFYTQLVLELQSRIIEKGNLSSTEFADAVAHGYLKGLVQGDEKIQLFILSEYVRMAAGDLGKPTSPVWSALEQISGRIGWENVIVWLEGLTSKSSVNLIPIAERSAALYQEMTGKSAATHEFEVYNPESQKPNGGDKESEAANSELREIPSDIAQREERNYDPVIAHVRDFVRNPDSEHPLALNTLIRTAVLKRVGSGYPDALEAIARAIAGEDEALMKDLMTAVKGADPAAKERPRIEVFLNQVLQRKFSDYFKEAAAVVMENQRNETYVKGTNGPASSGVSPAEPKNNVSNGQSTGSTPLPGIWMIEGAYFSKDDLSRKVRRQIEKGLGDVYRKILARRDNPDIHIREQAVPGIFTFDIEDYTVHFRYFYSEDVSLETIFLYALEKKGKGEQHLYDGLHRGTGKVGAYVDQFIDMNREEFLRRATQWDNDHAMAASDGAPEQRTGLNKLYDTLLKMKNGDIVQTIAALAASISLNMKHKKINDQDIDQEIARISNNLDSEDSLYLGRYYLVKNTGEDREDHPLIFFEITDQKNKHALSGGGYVETRYMKRLLGPQKTLTYDRGDGVILIDGTYARSLSAENLAAELKTAAQLYYDKMKAAAERSKWVFEKRMNDNLKPIKERLMQLNGEMNDKISALEGIVRDFEESVQQTVEQTNAEFARMSPPLDPDQIVWQPTSTIYKIFNTRLSRHGLMVGPFAQGQKSKMAVYTFKEWLYRHTSGTETTVRELRHTDETLRQQVSQDDIVLRVGDVSLINGDALDALSKRISSKTNIRTIEDDQEKNPAQPMILALDRIRFNLLRKAFRKTESVFPHLRSFYIRLILESRRRFIEYGWYGDVHLGGVHALGHLKESAGNESSQLLGLAELIRVFVQHMRRNPGQTDYEFSNIFMILSGHPTWPESLQWMASIESGKNSQQLLKDMRVRVARFYAQHTRADIAANEFTQFIRPKLTQHSERQAETQAPVQLDSESPADNFSIPIEKDFGRAKERLSLLKNDQHRNIDRIIRDSLNVTRIEKGFIAVLDSIARLIADDEISVQDLMQDVRRNDDAMGKMRPRIEILLDEIFDGKFSSHYNAVLERERIKARNTKDIVVQESPTVEPAFPRDTQGSIPSMLTTEKPDFYRLKTRIHLNKGETTLSEEAVRQVLRVYELIRKAELGIFDQKGLDAWSQRTYPGIYRIHLDSERRTVYFRYFKGENKILVIYYGNPNEVHEPGNHLRLETWFKEHMEKYSGYSSLSEVQNQNQIVKVDPAMSSSPGGIDLNASLLELEINRDGQGVPLPLAQQDMVRLKEIQGFSPVIIQIRPATELPQFQALRPASAADI